MKATNAIASPLAFGFAVAALTAPSLGALVVDFDTGTNGAGTLAARTLTTGIDLDSDTATDDSRNFRAFTSPGGAAWSTGGGYTGPALYGGFIGEAVNNTSQADDYGLTPFNIRYQKTTAPAAGRLHIAVVFDDNAAGPLTFSTGALGTSSMSIGGDNLGALPRFESLADVRWLVRNGTTYYISQTQIANDANGRVLSATELATEMWSVYNPADGFAFTLAPVFSTPTSALTDLNAFGLITYKNTFSSVRSWLSFNEFKVDAENAVAAAIVPEPATMALLAAGLGGMSLRRRRV